MSKSKTKRISEDLHLACDFLNVNDLIEIALKTGYSKAYVSMVKNRVGYNEEIEKHLYKRCKKRMDEKLKKILEIKDKL